MTGPVHRRAWLDHRRHLEGLLRNRQLRHTPEGPRHLGGLGAVLSGIGTVVGLSGLLDRGRRNAHDIRLTEVEFRFPHLPTAFDGYRILFISDLHVEHMAANMAPAATMVSTLPCDLALLGGDYQEFGRPSGAKTAMTMAPLVAALRPADGIFAILGNHDSHRVVEPLEALGVRMLLNESVILDRNGQSIRLIGCDDVHIFYSHSAETALRHGHEDFRIALVHSPDFAGQAAVAGCSLYLTGHTHGGQICLPGGRPVFTALDRNHRLARHAWRLHGMQGYTSTGLGVGLPAVRFKCPPEIVRITLRRGESAMTTG